MRSYSSTTVVAPPVIIGGGLGYSPFGYGMGMPFFAPVPFFGGGIFQLFFLVMVAGVVANVVRGIVGGMSGGAAGGRKKGPGAEDSWDEL